MQNKRNIIIAVVYRVPQTNVDDFDCEIDACLQKLENKINKPTLRVFLILTCWNYSTVNHVNDFVNMLYKKLYRPSINKPTRICKSSTTLIDNICTNGCLP